jgi:thiamine-monophosphate kinase
MKGERGLIAELSRIFGEPPGQVVCGIGDDTAVIGPDRDFNLLWTIDALIEGVHFDLSYTSLGLLGRKALAVNLSDIAAMGGEAQYALLALGWPPERDLQGALELARGMQSMAREYGAALIGGDTVSSPGGLTMSLTVIGRIKPDELLRRDEARAGDLIYVTGSLGQAAAGLEVLRLGMKLAEEIKNPIIQVFLDPRPQLAAGRVLARNHLATAAIDLSDGVASDLDQICLQSGVGAVVEGSRVPISAAVREAAALLGKEPLDLALKGGEDYHLLFTVDPDKQPNLHEYFSRADLPSPICIGTIVPGTGIKLRLEREDLEISGAGFDHFPGSFPGGDESE